MQEAVCGPNMPIVQYLAKWRIQLKSLYFYDDFDTTFEAFFMFLRTENDEFVFSIIFRDLVLFSNS